MSAVVDVRGLTKTFGSGATAWQALRGVDLEVNASEFLMLVGPSGSGKTTLLSIIGCVLRATSGEVRLFGEAITALPERALPHLRLSKLGFVFQGHNLIAALPARDNVAVVAELRGVSRRAALEEADALLAAVGLDGKQGSVAAQLSGGQRQRVAIARALIGSPPLLLADEPTAALDASSGLAAVELLKDLTRERGTTVLCVTHDPRIFGYADRIVSIEDGRIVPTAGVHP
jgi:putative ABC transport system ATP-binding protein